jgi:hypothetical protein
MAEPWLVLIQRWLWFLGTVFELLLVVRLFRLELARKYRLFLAYLVFDSVRSLVMWFYFPGSVAYRNLWRATEPVIWLLYVLVVLELCSLVFKDYRGIQALGRWIVYGSLALSVLLSIITVLPTWIHSTEEPFSMQRFLMVERGIDFAIVLLLLLLLAFLVLFPVQLSRNVIVHSVLFAAFFTTSSMGILVVNLTSYRLGASVSTILMGVTDFCLIAWMILMSRAGEEKIMAIRHPVPLDENRLVAQLAEINATLMRARKQTSPEASDVHR